MVKLIVFLLVMQAEMSLITDCLLTFTQMRTQYLQQEPHVED